MGWPHRRRSRQGGQHRAGIPCSHAPRVTPPRPPRPPWPELSDERGYGGLEHSRKIERSVRCEGCFEMICGRSSEGVQVGNCMLGGCASPDDSPTLSTSRAESLESIYWAIGYNYYNNLRYLFLSIQEIIFYLTNQYVATNRQRVYLKQSS